MKTILTISWAGTIVLHWFLFIFYIAMLPLAWFIYQIPLAIIINTVILRIAFSNQICPLSLLENVFARKIGKKERPLFMKGHVFPVFYYIKKLINNK